VTGRTSLLGALAGAAACVGLAAGVLYARDAAYPLERSSERLLYLTSGKTASRLMLSFDAIAADLYWIRAIQHYGRDARSLRTTDRFALLQPLLELTTSLDPYFTIAYRFGAIFLSEPPPDGPNRPDFGVALLEKGLVRNPTRWQFAMDAGFVHYWYTGDARAAAEWFEKAGAIPRAPGWLRALAASTLIQGGDRAGARQLLTELLKSEEEYIRNAATRALAQVQVLDDLDYLDGAVDRYRQVAKANPSSWDDLGRAGLIRALPRDPTGLPYLLDAATGRVDISPKSTLSPLPKMLQRKGR
jgi:tetratricopeptide (TPR) repeat protein